MTQKKLFMSFLIIIIVHSFELTTAAVDPLPVFEIELQITNSTRYCEGVVSQDGYLCSYPTRVDTWMSVVNVGTTTCDSTLCFGIIPIDLSAYSGITLSFLAPEGLQFDLGTEPSLLRFEVIMISTTATCSNASYIEDEELILSFDGDALDNIDETVMRAGQCNECTAGDIFGFFRFNRQSRPVKFRKFQATVHYNSTELCSGEYEYEWRWNYATLFRANTNDTIGIKFSPLDSITTVSTTKYPSSTTSEDTSTTSHDVTTSSDPQISTTDQSSTTESASTTNESSSSESTTSTSSTGDSFSIASIGIIYNVLLITITTIAILLM